MAKYGRLYLPPLNEARVSRLNGCRPLSSDITTLTIGEVYRQVSIISLGIVPSLPRNRAPFASPLEFDN